ncbi:MAG: four helix bundle protein [Candidatus Yanofskybacteria bacterium]|nr:four helix bundle protein [Candidatus Yanofskybacteria bacterium]
MNRSENLQARCLKFAKDIINLIRENKLDIVDSILAKQLVRSATSVGANIIEAQNSFSNKGFVNSYRIALKSSNESIFWLKLLIESNKFREDNINVLISESDQLSKIIASIILKVK